MSNLRERERVQKKLNLCAFAIELNISDSWLWIKGACRYVVKVKVN